MTTENKTTHSPLPWRAEESISGCKNIIVSADGREVGSIFGVGSTECAEKWEANAALIADAVNELEKMRGMVREILPILSWGISVCQWYRELMAIADKAGLLRLVEVKSLLAEEQTIRTLLDKARRAVGKDADDGQE